VTAGTACRLRETILVPITSPGQLTQRGDFAAGLRRCRFTRWVESYRSPSRWSQIQGRLAELDRSAYRDALFRKLLTEEFGSNFVGVSFNGQYQGGVSGYDDRYFGKLLAGQLAKRVFAEWNR
jgi:hypothetical protein